MFKNLLDSKKATIALAAALLGAVGVERGWSTEQIASVVAPLMAYMPMEMFVDHTRAKNPTQPPIQGP